MTTELWLSIHEISKFEKANAKSHTHLQFAPANATPKIAKEYVLPTLNSELKMNIGKPSRT